MAEDNSDTSVGCECRCGCDNWSCWSCGDFTSDMDKAEVQWVCHMCTANCASNLDYKMYAYLEFVRVGCHAQWVAGSSQGMHNR